MEARRKPRRKTGHVRVPAFAPVPLRGRRDGWTPDRQARFLGALAETRSVEAAARRVGMARETAYRLRRRPGAGGFAAAWDKVLGRIAMKRRKVTLEERAQRARHGLLKPRMYGGRHVATERKRDDRALVSLLGHYFRVRRGRASGGATEGGFACPSV
ncbi:hypothetical protein V2S85_03195 [Novosphingobium resinovorum]|nr:hypothetical protein [Novosphingobium resinovorum]